MASGFDGRFGVAKETTYDTRVAPTRFFPITGEGNNYEYGRYFSPALGTGLWGRPSIITTQGGEGSITGDVTTTGFGYLLDGLHANAVTPVQQASTIAYLQTHTLNTAPSKSFSIQVQMPPRSSSTLLPHDLTGVMWQGIAFNWASAGVLSYEIPTAIRTLDLTQTLATYTPPAAYDLFSFKQGVLTIAGVTETNVLGDGSFTIGYPLQTDARALGSDGKMAKPVLTAKPTAEGTFEAAFEDNTNLTRVINNTVADAVLTFTGAVIVGAHNFQITITIPDCVFTTGRPTLGDAGPIMQTVTFSAASSTADPPIITYKSTDVSL